VDNRGHVSIIIPAYNEIGSITHTIEEIDRVMKSQDYVYEVVVVDDGSTDGTAEMVKNQPSARIIQHPCNRGYGASLKTGIKNARGEIILIIDADSTYPVEKIPLLLSQMNEYDMVVGARTSKDAKIQLVRRPAKWVLSVLANYLSGTRIPDLNSGLRAFKKEIALKFFDILPDQFSFTTTITLGMICNGYTIKYEPIAYHRRVGKSKISPIRDTSNFILLIVRTVMYFNPLKIFLPISLFLAVLGTAMLCYDIFVIRNIGDKTVLLFSMALLIGAIGLLADLIVKKIGSTGK
jgi:glycosyltransferase involved in cell wall biosynthesis